MTAMKSRDEARAAVVVLEIVDGRDVNQRRAREVDRIGPAPEVENRAGKAEVFEGGQRVDLAATKHATRRNRRRLQPSPESFADVTIVEGPRGQGRSDCSGPPRDGTRLWLGKPGRPTQPPT